MIVLGRCDNHIEVMFSGGLVPKGPRCSNRASLVMVYVETTNLWDGTPGTREIAKLCDECFAHARIYVGQARRLRTKQKGSSEGSSWVRRIKRVSPDKITREHVVALCRSHKQVPKMLLDHFGLDRDGHPRSEETTQREAQARTFWAIFCGEVDSG